MRNKSHKAEYFYFTIDNWTREYGFEVNHFKWELSPHHYAENDAIQDGGQPLAVPGQ